MKNKISVFVPATVANLGCGFDSMGLAIDSPGDELTLQLNNKKEIRIIKISGDRKRLSYDPKKNTASVAIQSLLDYLHIDQGFDLFLKKKMPLGSGLGSSAASAVAGAFAANELLGSVFDKKELITFAMDGEKVASGSAHADNAAPAMLGGIILIRSYDPLEIISLPSPSKLHVVVIYPEVEVLTKTARKLLPRKILLKDAIAQWSNTAAFVSAVHNSDIGLMGRSTEDRVAEPYRNKLIPFYDKVKSSALENGATGCNISGSGPSMFALADNIKTANAVGEAMQKQFTKGKIKSHVFISKINTRGARII